MKAQIARAQRFRSLHVPHAPIILCNIWDAGSAMAVARGGAKAVATGSWSVAAAQGYADGEAMPLDEVLANVARIVRCVDLPVSVDFEGGYAVEPSTIRDNVGQLLSRGVIGLNFEDQVVGGAGLFSIEDQTARLNAVRSGATALGIPAFVNARTDLFLRAAPGSDHGLLMDEAIARQAAYAKTGADGFFVPGLTDKALIRQLCERTPLPVNIMLTSDVSDVSELRKLGVARISFGPAPFMEMAAKLEHRAKMFD